jgi:hypothetical protein
MIFTGFAVIIHAVFPFLFVNTGGDLARNICKDIDSRNG